MKAALAMLRGGWLVAAGVILVALAMLVIAGLGGVVPRTYALRAPNQYPLVTLEPGHTVCEGPVTSPTPFRGAAIWGAAIGPSATLRVSARVSPSSRVLASGSTLVRSAEEEQQAELNTTVAGGVPVRVCVTDERGRFSIAGSPAVDARITMTGGLAQKEFSLLLLGRRQSLFSALPTIFSRAALFRPSWVGAWTFWVLGAGLLGAFALALVAVSRALQDDCEVAEEE